MKEPNRISDIDIVQSIQYSFPYHYIPNINKFPNFSKIWAFAPSYLAAIKLFLEWFPKIDETVKHNHMDYGCGDGGFVNAIKSNGKFSSVNFFGIDFDENAIRWALIFSKEKDSFVADDVKNLPKESYDSGSLIEVYEHIPPDECDQFLSAIAESLKEEAPLFVTVPSIEKPVALKHYRHFDFETLSNEFKKYFYVEEIYGFEKKSFYTDLINKFLVTRWWYFEIRIINELFIKKYSAKHASINGCGRIGMIVRKK
jgi:2-polyprenyl-3-methyl-5-hydroxy-6-metoxy-1,4-benzoquinol methylase